MLVEPLEIVRAGLRLLFSAQRDMDVVGEASDAGAALDVITTLGPQANTIVFIGLELQGERDSSWLIRAIREQSPSIVILATGTDLTRDAISRSLFFGADGFVHKNSPPDRFIEAARRAAAGELVLEGLPRGALGGIIDGIDQQRAGVPALTEREVGVLTAAAYGLTARQIGRRLGVSERTVTTHLHNIYRKLNAGGRVAAVSRAIQFGLLSISPTRPNANASPEVDGFLVAR